MKILLATRSETVFSNYQTIVEELLADGHTVRILFDQMWSASNRSPMLDSLLVEHSKFETGWLAKRPRVMRRISFILQEFRSLSSYHLRDGGHQYYEERQRKYFLGSLPSWVRIIVQPDVIVRTMAQSNSLFRIAGLIDSSLPVSGAIKSDIEAFAPDLILATPTNLRYSNEPEYLRVGNSLGIPTVICTLTWDNLTTKGHIPVIPKCLFTWNNTQAKEAREIHRIPSNTIRVTGSPTFDKWLDQELEPMQRQEFESVTQLAPDTRFILYMGSSANIAGDEGHLPVDLADNLASVLGPGLAGLKILVRPSPATVSIRPRHFR
jgi:hypothetical protein